MLCIPGDIGQLTIGSVWYRLEPGMWEVGGDDECMGWSGVWVEVVNGVGSGTSVGSTCMGEGGHVTSTGTGRAGIGVGAGAAGGGAGAGAGAGGTGDGWERKIEGPGL
jgi:hypothetical protein